MALSDQLLGQVRNNPLGTAVKLRRATYKGATCAIRIFLTVPYESGRRPNGSVISISLEQVLD